MNKFISRIIYIVFYISISCFFSCSSNRPAEKAVKESTQTVISKEISGPAKITTPKGAVLQVPANFKATKNNNLITICDNEQETFVHLLEIEENSISKAVEQAWKIINPSFSNDIEEKLTPPASGGYDEFHIINYVIGKNKVFTQVFARRKENHIWVSIIQATIANIEKRNAQIKTFLSSLEVPGIKEIELTDLTPTSILKSKDTLKIFINNLLKTTGTPGLSIAVVEDGKMVLAEGFGVLELGKADKINEDTLMLIGSVSKSLTTLMTAVLVDKGILFWSSPVIDLMPNFCINDPDLTKTLTFENLFCACTGLPRKDLPLVFNYANKKPEDVFLELKDMSPTTGFKETFQYQNHLVAAGGYIAAKMYNKADDYFKSYNHVMTELVFKPLGMANTTLDFKKVYNIKNRALPHSQDFNYIHHNISLEYEKFAEFVSPSGGIWSTAKDMAKFILTELSQGLNQQGHRIVSKENLTYRWNPQVSVNAKDSYGLGLITSKYKGLLHITHNGGTMGFAAKISFFPNKNLGVVMLSNGTGGHLVESIILTKLIELWFGIDDNSQKNLDFSLKIHKETIEKSNKSIVNLENKFILPFLGTFKNAQIGTIIINKIDSKYKAEIGNYKTELKQFNSPDGKSLILFSDPPFSGFTLIPLNNNKNGSFKMSRGQEEYIFSNSTTKH